MAQTFGFDILACTITGSASGEGKYVRQSGSADRYGHVALTIEPHRGRRHFLLEWAVDEDTIPAEFRPAIIAGIQSVAVQGIPELGPFVNIKVTVTGGSFHEVDSSEVGYKAAASIAFRNALAQTMVTRVPMTKQDLQHWDEADEVVASVQADPLIHSLAKQGAKMGSISD